MPLNLQGKPYLGGYKTNDLRGMVFLGGLMGGLLETDDLKRANFNTKKANYLTTKFKLAQKVAEYENWNLQNLTDYQEWLAQQAVKTWRVN